MTASHSCISSRLPCHFKICLILCAFGIIVIFNSINSTWHNAVQRVLSWQIKNYGDVVRIENTVKLESKNDWTRMCAGNVTEEEFERLFPNKPESQINYILPGFEWLCGGLGNQMWRFASLYGIGKPYGRRPIFTEEQRCLKENGPHESEEPDEMKNLFPIFYSQQKFIKLDLNKTLVLEGYAQDCCKFDDPQRMKFSKFKQKYVKIASNYFQSYKFFESRRQEIRQIFQFSQNVCATVEKYKEQLFGKDEKHKMCLHTRIEDFVQFGFESTKEFTEKAIHFVQSQLKERFGPVSLVLLGAEKDFLANISINREVYLPKPMPRGHDLSFGTIACDSLLITAPASTFSWWMAYLMPDDAPIFYNSALEKTPYVRENFLPEWTPIRLENGTIVLD